MIEPHLVQGVEAYKEIVKSATVHIGTEHYRIDVSRHIMEDGSSRYEATGQIEQTVSQIDAENAEGSPIQSRLWVNHSIPYAIKDNPEDAMAFALSLLVARDR